MAEEEQGRSGIRKRKERRRAADRWGRRSEREGNGNDWEKGREWPRKEGMTEKRRNDWEKKKWLRKEGMTEKRRNDWPTFLFPSLFFFQPTQIYLNPTQILIQPLCT
jgi:hypothetical protein